MEESPPYIGGVWGPPQGKFFFFFFYFGGSGAGGGAGRGGGAKRLFLCILSDLRKNSTHEDSTIIYLGILKFICRCRCWEINTIGLLSSLIKESFFCEWLVCSWRSPGHWYSPVTGVFCKTLIVSATVIPEVEGHAWLQIALLIDQFRYIKIHTWLRGLEE